MSIICKIIGALIFIFGVADLYLFYFQDVDLTGVSWSPYAAFILGSVVWNLGNKDEAKEEA